MASDNPGDGVARRLCADAFFVNVIRAVDDEAGPGVLVGSGAYVRCENEVQALLSILGDRIESVLGGPQISYATGVGLETLFPNRTETWADPRT